MRILMLATFRFPEGTLGASRALHMQAKGLSEAGHEVVVGVCHGSLGATREALDGFWVRTFAVNKKEGVALRKALSWVTGQARMLVYLVGAVLARKFDNIVFYGPAPIFVVGAIVGKLRKQQTSYIQGDILNPRATPLHALTEVVLARSSSLIIVGGSSLLAAHLARIAPRSKQIRLWPPTDTDYFSKGDPVRARERLSAGGAPLIGYAGAVSRLEGVDVLIRSMRSVRERFPEARLIIAGFVLERDPIGGEPLRYAEMIESLGLGKSVVLAGPLPMSEIADLYAAADVLVNPKVDHPVNRMASPIKVGEYLAAGRPVLTTKVCELEAWLRDGCDVLFCSDGEPEALAAGICELLSNSELAGRLSREGPRVARRVCDYRAWGLMVAEAMAGLGNVA